MKKLIYWIVYWYGCSRDIDEMVLDFNTLNVGDCICTYNGSELEYFLIKDYKLDNNEHTYGVSLLNPLGEFLTYFIRFFDSIKLKMMSWIR